MVGFPYCWIFGTWGLGDCRGPGVFEIVTIAEVTPGLGLSLLLLGWVTTWLLLLVGIRELHELGVTVWFGEVTHTERMLSCGCLESWLKSWPFCSSIILSWLFECTRLGGPPPWFLEKSLRFRLTSSF